MLFKAPIDFLGHAVSAEGIESQTEKIAAIRDWPTPHCLRDLRAFFGLASYYRRFVKDFATIAEPLSRLTRKGIAFHWTDKTQLAFGFNRSIPWLIHILIFLASWTPTPRTLPSGQFLVRSLGVWRSP